MKKTKRMFLLMVFFRLITMPVQAQESGKSVTPIKKEFNKKAAAFNSFCPVSGEETDAAITITFDGKVYA